MGVFNINFDQFKPSTKVATPIASTPPVMKSSPVPVAQPIQMQSVPQQKTSGLQKVFNVLSAPSKWTEKVLTKGKGYENAYNNPDSFLRKADLSTRAVTKLTGKDPYKVNPNTAKVMSTASRFAYDPLNVIPFGKVGSVVGKVASKVDDVVGVSKVVKKVADYAKATPKIYKVIEKINPYFRNPEFGKVVKAAEQATGTKINALYRGLSGMVKNLTPEDQVHIGEVIEGIAKPKNKTFLEIATKVKGMTEDVGKEAVKVGLLTKKSFNAMTKKGYLSHIESLVPDIEKVTSKFRDIPKATSAQFKKRTGKLENYVKEFAPVAFKGLGSEVKAIETVKMFRDIASKFGQKLGRGEKAAAGFVRASDMGIKGRPFAKAFGRVQIPQEIAEYITKVREVNKPGVYDKLLNAWKAGKTIFNPAYHVRNTISNQILSSMGTGKNLISTVSDYIRAVKEYKAGTSSLFKTAQEIGLVGRRSFGTGLNELLDTAGLTKQTLLQKFANKPKQLQNITEETSKLNVFKVWMERLGRQNGLDLESALKNKDIVKQAMDKAEEAIFSPYRISQAERSTIGSKIPFYSFTRQALPFTAKTLVNNPKSIAVFGKIKDAIEQLSEDPKVELPDYMKNQIRLGNQNGEVTYFDPTYTYPFGNFVETGLGKGQLPFGLSLDPFAMEAVQQLANKDLYFGNEIAKSNLTAKQIGQRLAHLYRTVSPQALVTLTNTIYPALIGKKDSQGRTRNVAQAILSALGIKTSTVNAKNIQVQNLRSQKSKDSSIQQEISNTINDNNMSREKKEKDINKLRSLQP